MIKVERHKKGWAVVKVISNELHPSRTVLSIYRTKAEATKAAETVR